MSEFKLCPKCRGKGTVVHEALSVWTEEDRYADPEGFEEMRRGVYDVACPRCGGEKVVPDTEEEVDDWQDREWDRRTRMAESGMWPY